MVTLLISEGEIVSNDGTHTGHGPDNPDTGETSAFALALGEKLQRYGLTTTVTREEE